MFTNTEGVVLAGIGALVWHQALRNREEVHAEYLASIQAYRNGTGYSVPGEFVFMLARKE